MSVQKANKNEVRKEIADLINRIKEQSDRIGMQREIPQSELDLILHRIEELHRKTVVWSYLNELPSSFDSAQDDKLPESASGSKFEVLSPEAANNTHVEPVVKEVKQIDPVPAPEPVVMKHTQPEPQKEPVKGPVVNDPPPTPEPPKVIVEPVKEEVKNVSKPTENVTRSATGNPKPGTGNGEPGTPNLKDIKTFIGFNEKLMYIRQVFKGDGAAYDAAIAQFNSMSSWDEASAFLSVLASEYKWGKHDEPVEIFTQTVKRRFS